MLIMWIFRQYWLAAIENWYPFSLDAVVAAVCMPLRCGVLIEAHLPAVFLFSSCSIVWNMRCYFINGWCICHFGGLLFVFGKCSYCGCRYLNFDQMSACDKNALICAMQHDYPCARCARLFRQICRILN